MEAYAVVIPQRSLNALHLIIAPRDIPLIPSSFDVIKKQPPTCDGNG